MPDSAAAAWARFFPPGRPTPLETLAPEERHRARTAADVILAAHRVYLQQFQDLTAQAQSVFEQRDWARGKHNAEQRVRLYRTIVNDTWQKLRDVFPDHLLELQFWMAARQAFLQAVLDDYDADLALTLFYSTMRLALAQTDIPVEYEDDGLARPSRTAGGRRIWRLYPASPDRLASSVASMLDRCSFRAPFENRQRDAALCASRMIDEWRRQCGTTMPRWLQIARPALFRDREAYLVGKLRTPGADMPVVFGLLHNDCGIVVDAVLAGREDMRNLLFVSTRSTFHVSVEHYRELLDFLDSLAPERGHPAMCAVIGFTHPARVALNQSLRRHLAETGECFARTPGRIGMAMIVFSPPSFPYVFKIIRDSSVKPSWMGRSKIMELYRWVHEINRGRLMLDAWLYRNVRFPRDAFEPSVLEELLTGASGSVHLEGHVVVLRHVYAQRRVRPLNTFFDETRDRALRERAAGALGAFIKDLAGMGLFFGDHYGLPFNTGLTHGFNVALFDFDDLGPLLPYRFRKTPLMPEEDEMHWNPEADGAWFPIAENDVLVDEWESFLGVPTDLQDYFRRTHGEIFTLSYWTEAQRRMASGGLHFVLPYPPDRRLAQAPPPRVESAS
jgi:isocitrate dehydrogenase kinase/phosphatase